MAKKAGKKSRIVKKAAKKKASPKKKAWKTSKKITRHGAGGGH